MEPAKGFEPPTRRLQSGRSTAELRRQIGGSLPDWKRKIQDLLNDEDIQSDEWPIGHTRVEGWVCFELDRNPRN